MSKQTSVRQAIVTRFLPVTNCRNARVKATCDAATITLDWDHSLDVFPNHRRVALALVKHLGWKGSWIGGSIKGGGYAFVDAGSVA